MSIIIKAILFSLKLPFIVHYENNKYSNFGCILKSVKYVKKNKTINEMKSHHNLVKVVNLPYITNIRIFH